jgi:hypothetical protein
VLCESQSARNARGREEWATGIEEAGFFSCCSNRGGGGGGEGSTSDTRTYDRRREEELGSRLHGGLASPLSVSESSTLAGKSPTCRPSRLSWERACRKHPASCCTSPCSAPRSYPVAGQLCQYSPVTSDCSPMSEDASETLMRGHLSRK